MPKYLYRRGNTWYARFFVAGQLQRVSLQTSDLREARLRLKSIREKAERQAFGVKDAPTWEQAVVAYNSGVLDSGGVKPNTAKRYRVSLRQVHEAFAGCKLDEITRVKIASYVEDRQQVGATNATIRRDLTTISRVLAFACNKGMVVSNASDLYDRSLLKERRASIAAPSAASIELGISAAAAAGQPELGMLMRFLRAHGMRLGEALRAEWRHIQGNRLTIHETKTGLVRTIDADPATLPPRERRGVPVVAGRLFPGLSTDPGIISSLWARIKRRLPPEHRFRLHDLRHGYAIEQIQAGRDIYDLSHHLGHSSVKVTEIYLGFVPGGRSHARRG